MYSVFRIPQSTFRIQRIMFDFPFSIFPARSLRILHSEFRIEWSEWRESNPRDCLGKAEHYHYATLA